MNIKKENGSITIFVLVALLFMSAFLLISYANNVNKSKIAKEQFNIISDIYSHNDTDEEAYNRAYTALRKKNRQILTATAENKSTLEINKTYKGKLDNYKIYGNSIQKGTPSVTNPVEIQSVGDKTSNLFDINCGFETNNTNIPTKIENSNIIIPYSSQNDLSAEFNQYIPVSGNQEYTCSFTLVQGSARILIKLYDESKNLINDSTISISGFTYNTYYKGFFINASQKTITFPSNIKYIRFCTVAMNYSNGVNNIYSNFQFIKGSTVKEYEPYGKYKIPVKISNKSETVQTFNIYLDEPLRKIGNYADYINFKNQKIYRNVEKIDDTGKLTITESYKGISDNVGSDINIPELKTFEDYTKIEILTETSPSKIEVNYEGYTFE